MQFKLACSALRLILDWAMAMNDLESIEIEIIESLAAIREKASSRKQQLLCCASIRRLWCRLSKSAQTALMRAESVADDLDFPTSTIGVSANAGNSIDRKDRYAQHAVSACCEIRPDAIAALTYASIAGDSQLVERTSQLSLIHDIHEPFLQADFTNPLIGFPVHKDIFDLANRIYEGRHPHSGVFDHSHMVVLADNLLRFGFRDVAMLSHCRVERIHVRGCWVIDILLGKT